MFQKSLQKKTAQEKNHQIQKKTLVGFEKLWCSYGKYKKWLLIQKTFTAWRNMKFMKVISKVYFHSFLKYFYPVIY